MALIDPQQLAVLEQQNGLPQGLLAAVQQAESAGNPSAVSTKGALGAFQFMPATAQQYGINPLDPLQAADGAARMYGDLSKQFGGDVPSMLAAYNWGSGNLEKKGLANAPQETKDYIAKITGAMGKQYAQADTGNMSDATVDNAPTELPKGAMLLNEGAPTELPEGATLIDAAEKPSLLNKISSAYDKRSENTQQYMNRTANGMPSAGGQLNALGNAAGFLTGDIPGAVLGSITPEAIKKPVEQAVNWLANSQAGSALKQLAQKYPETTRAAGSLANLAMVIPATEAAGVVKSATGSALENVGSALEKSGQQSAQAAKSKFVQDLITPKETPTVKADQFSRSTEQGILRNRVVEPSPQEQAVISTVSQLPVSKNKSLLANHNIIEDAKNAEAQSLIAHLQKNDVPISDDSVVNALNQSYEDLKKNPYLSGDGRTAANDVISGALEHIINNPSTASGLLQARKDFDAWVTRLKSERAFDPKTEGPVTTAIQKVRQTINNLVDQAVPDANVKASLAKQSNLYRAMDNIQTKGGYEGKNIISRGAQKAAKAIPVKGVIAKTALTTGLAGSAAMAPVLTGGALAAYGAKKAITSPALRKGVGYTLKNAGKIIK